jgi:sugar phosphate isomerase/epimerase
LSLGYRAETLADLPAALDMAEGLGVDSVEVFAPSLGVVLNGRVVPGRLRELRRLLTDRPFAVTLHGPLSGALGAPSGQDRQRAVTTAMLEVAHALGAEVLVQHASVVAPDDAERAVAQETAALRGLGPLAAQAGCVIAVETMWARAGEWSPLPGELAAMLAEVDHPNVGATLDFSHAWLNAVARGVDPLAQIARLAPRARHLHLHDSFGRPPVFRPWSRGDAMAFGFGDLHLPPGLGALPWDALAALDYPDGPIANLELEARWADQLPDAVAWARGWTRGLRPPAPRRAAAGA